MSFTNYTAHNIAQLRTYHYGVVKVGKKNKLVAFIVRDQESIPVDAIETRTRITTSKEVKALSDAMLAEYEETAKAESMRIATLPPPAADLGEIVYFSDGDGTHTAIFLESVGDDCFALFLTSNPYWNPACRPITQEEMAFTGMPVRMSRSTYLAPVLRPSYLMTRTGVSIPSHRVTELLKEFDREEARKY